MRYGFSLRHVFAGDPLVQHFTQPEITAVGDVPGQFDIKHPFQHIGAEASAGCLFLGDARTHALEHIAHEHGLKLLNRVLQTKFLVCIQRLLALHDLHLSCGVHGFHQMITSSAFSAPERFSA